MSTTETEILPNFSTKWPAARLYGPAVTVEQALDIILRTDSSLSSLSWMCNDTRFENHLRHMIGRRKNDDWEVLEDYQKNYGHVRLEYMASHWVASSYIFGPHGPVHPDGTLGFAINFGKYPTVEEVESDLKAMSAAFPYLDFHLFLWDQGGEHNDVTNELPPTHGWHVRDGSFLRLQEPAAAVDMTLINPAPELSISGFMNRRETTWTVEGIKAMWGDKLQKAMSDAVSSNAHRLRLAARAEAERQVKEIRFRKADIAGRSALREARAEILKHWILPKDFVPADLTVEQAHLLLNIDDALRKLGGDVGEFVYDDFVTTVLGESAEQIPHD